MQISIKYVGLFVESNGEQLDTLTIVGPYCTPQSKRRREYGEILHEARRAEGNISPYSLLLLDWGVQYGHYVLPCQFPGMP